ncbi:MAG: hypothetical protein EOO90_19195 [Pedobacter sp.]|nr:MAG: hypothetical protein EOO90_19195 [Pedobacter sp.]
MQRNLFYYQLFALLMIFPSVVKSQKITTDSIYSSYQRLIAGDANLFEIADWKQKRKQLITEKTESLSPTVKKGFIAKGERVLKQQWTLLSATDFLEFTRTGNRANFEKKYKARREMLKDLVIAESLEKKGRFVPMITDGVWLICEESTWSLPATLNVDQDGFGLPEVYNPIVDLCVAQTSVLLSWTKFLLSNELSKVNSKLIPRIDYEINTRALKPFLNRNDLWWMGFTGRKPNNWNIYCNYYMLVTALLSSDDQKLNQQVIAKTIKSAQFFLAHYANDGGCDEGPSYWNMAGGTFGMFVKTLSDISGNKMDFSKHQKIHNMGAYIHKVHIDSNYFVNFADAATIVSIDPVKVFNYGTMFNDQKLKAFGAYFFQQNWDKNKSMQSDEINVFFSNLELADQLLKQKPGIPLPPNSWLPDLQVLTSRQLDGNAKGLFFGAKGGHNAESHNHNDVGNFVLYLDGKPVIIDIGVGTYTKDTFNENRWEIWNIRSLWHNLPLINGIEQRNGLLFNAKQVNLSSTSNSENFTLDISTAYPAEAEVNRWTRNFTLDRSNQSLILKENYELKKWLQPTELSFISHLPVSKVKEGVLRFDNPHSKRSVELHYNPSQLSFSIETKEQTDPKLIGLWGKELRRVILKTKDKKLADQLQLRFSISE